MTVMSVLGPLERSALGRVLVHEHLVISQDGEALDPNAGPDRAEILAIAVDQLQKLKDHGVGTIVDPCPIELGRDPEFYAEASQRSGVNVVFATGFYMEAMGLPHYWRARDKEEITELYLKAKQILHDPFARHATLSRVLSQIEKRKRSCQSSRDCGHADLPWTRTGPRA